jgi:hypothetical protein
MIADDQEIERPRQLRPLSGGGPDFLATGEAIGGVRLHVRADGAGVERDGGVQVRVAEVRAGGKVASGIGRVPRLLECLRGGLLVELPQVVRRGRRHNREH